NILRKVLQVDPTYLVARNNLGALLSDRGQTKEAAQIFDAANKATETTRVGYPRTWAAALNLAHLAHARNDDPAALDIIDKVRCVIAGRRLREYPLEDAFHTARRAVARETDQGRQ